MGVYSDHVSTYRPGNRNPGREVICPETQGVSMMSRSLGPGSLCCTHTRFRPSDNTLHTQSGLCWGLESAAGASAPAQAPRLLGHSLTFPQGHGQDGSPGLEAFHRAKSLGERFSLRRSAEMLRSPANTRDARQGHSARPLSKATQQHPQIQASHFKAVLGA